MAATQTALQAWNFCEFITGLGLLISSSDEKDWNGLPEEDDVDGEIPDTPPEAVRESDQRSKPNHDH